MSKPPYPDISFETDTFEIFSGLNERNAQWVEAVVGFASAKRRMEEIAAKQPGDYFLFHDGTRSILTKISNGPMSCTGKSKKEGAA